MAPSILVDTGPLYALADPDDQYHSRANRELSAIRNQGKQIMALYPTVLEAYTLISRYLTLDYAHMWLDSTLAGIGLINPTPKDYFQSVEKVKTYKDQHITLFDAILTTVSDQLELPVWTFDSDFDVMKANVWRE